MNCRRFNAIICLACLISIPEFCSGQIILRGMVTDSVSMHALPNVNISIKTTGTGTVSDFRGSFELKAKEQDMIVFSRVGYLTEVLSARDVNQMMRYWQNSTRRIKILFIGWKAMKSLHCFMFSFPKTLQNN